MLSSYSFNAELPDNVWNVFKNCEQIQGDFYTLEVLRGVQEGKISADENTKFNLQAYVNRVEKNKFMEKCREGKKKVSIVDDTDDPFELEGLTEDIVSGFVEEVDFVEDMAESDEVRWAVNQINTRAREWMITYKLDVPFCIRQALRGMPESRDLLKKIIADNEVAAECIHAVLASGIEFNKLFPEKGE